MVNADSCYGRTVGFSTYADTVINKFILLIVWCDPLIILGCRFSFQLDLLQFSYVFLGDLLSILSEVEVLDTIAAIGDSISR